MLRASSFIFILSLIILGLQKPFYYVSNIAFGYALSALVLYLFFRRNNIIPNVDINIFKKNFNFASYTYLANLCAIIIFNVDLIMVSSFLGAESAGYYSIALSLSNGILVFPELIWNLLFSRLSTSHDRLEKWKQTKKVCFYLILFMFPLLVTAGLVAHLTVLILFGNEYLPAVESFIWTLPAIFFLSIGISPSKIFIFLRTGQMAYMGSYGSSSCECFHELSDARTLWPYYSSYFIYFCLHLFNSF